MINQIDFKRTFDKQMVVKNYAEYWKKLSWKTRLWTMARNTSIFFLSLKGRINEKREWIRFPLYHGVFDDERIGFDRQLRFMKKFGDFISLNDAVDLLINKNRIGGHYFCINFDDGYKNVLTNAIPILIDHSITASIFITTDFIGSDFSVDNNLLSRYYTTFGPCVALGEFLSWDDCQNIIELGMIIGSHSCGHLNLMQLSMESIEYQLKKSKEEIEKRLSISCRHFACPYGIPNLHFPKELVTSIAQKIGYSSLLTGERGANYQGQDPYYIRRDTLQAFQANYHLRYFFSQNS